MPDVLGEDGTALEINKMINVDVFETVQKPGDKNFDTVHGPDVRWVLTWKGPETMRASYVAKEIASTTGVVHLLHRSHPPC